MRKKRLGKNGFSLAELLLAAGLLAFAISGILALFISCIFLNEGSRNTTLATSHAQYALEDLKNTSFGSIVSFSWDSEAISNKGLQPLNNESLSCTVSGSFPKSIAVTVNWQDRGIRDRTLSLNTIIAEP
jgi:type II secretory pathway pseudopilin PulG